MHLQTKSLTKAIFGRYYFFSSGKKFSGLLITRIGPKPILNRLT